MENNTLKKIRGCSRYDIITKLLREETVEWILSHINVKPSCVPENIVTILK